MAGSLFDRLTRGEAGLRMDEDESIRRHLMRMLTTRQGAVQALPDYGLPDLNDLSLSRAEVIRRCCSAIEECIAGYEPRLHGAKVGYMHLEEDQFTMAFRIEAMRVDCEGRQIPWRWSVVMDGDQVKETA
jgi:type VI secretion system protein